MSIITYPLNGITYDASDAETYLCTRTSGVFSDSGCFDISITDDLTVQISAGIAWIRNTDFKGKSVCMDEAEELSISTGDATYDRIDRIVLNFSTVDNATTLEVLEGDPSSSAEAPDITQDSDIYQLCLYEIEVPAGCTQLDESYITDTRLDSDLCGKMTDSVTPMSDYMLADTYDPEGGAKQVSFADTAVTHTAGTAVGSATKPVYVMADGAATASGSTVGSSEKPVYMSSGTITACGTPTSGAWFQGVPYVSSGGATEIGRYLDFHPTDDSELDYGVRLDGGTSTTKRAFTFPSTAGEFVTHTASTAIGGTAKPVYISSAGVATACSSTVGGTAKPVYMSSGTITACSSTVGSGVIPTYMSSGTITASTSTAGGTAKPVYLNAGTITACSSTVGGTAKPVYLNAGTITACSSTVGGTTKPVYLNAGTITACSSTVGGTAKPVYMSSGAITACSSTVGGTAKPVYMSSGAITACSSTVGGAHRAVYLNAGTITTGLWVQNGSVTITPTAANTPTSVSVTFDSAFTGIYIVLVNPSTTVPGTGVTGCCATDISTTGCTIYFTRTSTTSTSVRWIAIGY